MVEKDNLFSSKVKYIGIFNFAAFYQFCYSWLTQETGLSIVEDKYIEKLSGDSKNIEISWVGSKVITDYFKYEAKISFKISDLTKVEINRGGTKINTNKGSVEVSVKGILVKDYKGKFETNAFNKFLRGIYEKWIITERINQVGDKITEDCNEFLSQAKEFLDLEGKK